MTAAAAEHAAIKQLLHAFGTKFFCREKKGLGFSFQRLQALAAVLAGRGKEVFVNEKTAARRTPLKDSNGGGISLECLIHGQTGHFMMEETILMQ